MNKCLNESCKKECLNNQLFLETVAMQVKIPLDKMQYALNDFNLHLITSGEVKETLKEYKYHFTSWARIMKNLKN